MSRSRTKSDEPESPTFENLLDRIESIVTQLESGRLGLDESLVKYEEGVQHLKNCMAMLEKAERKVSQVSGLSPDGTPRTQPFEEGSLSLEEKADRRGSRRSASGRVRSAGQQHLEFPD